MIERQWGRIITTGSSGIERPIAGFALSKAVPAADAGRSKTLSTELAPHGVTVNMILLCRSDTDRVRVLDDIRARNAALELAAVLEASRRDIPGGRYGCAEEFAAAAIFFLPASRRVTLPGRWWRYPQPVTPPPASALHAQFPDHKLVLIHLVVECLS